MGPGTKWGISRHPYVQMLTKLIGAVNLTFTWVCYDWTYKDACTRP